MNFFHTLLPSQKKPKFWVNRPHEGPEEYEFDLVAVVFSDGITRFILKSEIVVNELKRLNGNVMKFSIYPEAGHNSWDAAFAEPDFLSWLFSFKK